MKRLVFFLFFLSKFVSGQTVLFLDSITKTPIEGVSIFIKSNGVTSNNKGEAPLNVFKANDTLKITHVGYEKKIVVCSKIKKTLLLSPKNTLLPTIVFKDSPKLFFDFCPPIITASVLRKSVESNSAANLLENLSPITVQESQSGGGSPNFRGMEANRLLLIVDGVSINNAISKGGHSQNSSIINPFFVESINIVSGPSSVAFGDGAMGSAVLFNTFFPKFKSETQHYFFQKYETSANSVSLNYKTSYSFQNTAFLSAFSLKTSENLKMGSVRNHNYTSWGNDTSYIKNCRQLYTEYDNAAFLQKIRLKLGSETEVLFNTQYSTSSKINRFDKLNDLEDSFRKYSEWYYGPQNHFMQKANISSLTPTWLYDKIGASFSFQKTTESRHHKKYDEVLMSNRFENLSVYDFGVDLNKSLFGARISYGSGGRSQFLASSANKSSEDGRLFYNTTRYPDGGSVVRNMFVYSQVGLPLSKKLTFFFGGRLNQNILSAYFVDTTTYSFPFDKIKTKNNSLVSSLLMNYQFLNNFRLTAAYYSGFRNPNIDDVAKVFSKNDNSVVIPNPSLLPEKAKNMEIGFQAALWHSIFIRFDYFNTHIINAIQRENGLLNGDSMMVYDGEIMRIQMNKNIDAASIYGGNVLLEYQPSEAINLYSRYNFIAGKTDKNTPLAHIPPKNGIFGVEYILKNHFFDFYVKYNGWKNAEEYDLGGVDNLEEATIDGNPSWHTINFYYLNNLWEKISIGVGVQNIMDIHYKVFASGLSASGRNFTLSLSTNF